MQSDSLRYARLTPGSATARYRTAELAPLQLGSDSLRYARLAPGFATARYRTAVLAPQSDSLRYARLTPGSATARYRTAVLAPLALSLLDSRRLRASTPEQARVCSSVRASRSLGAELETRESLGHGRLGRSEPPRDPRQEPDSLGADSGRSGGTR